MSDRVIPEAAVEALLKLADDMEKAMHGGPESIGPTGRRFNASERILDAYSPSAKTKARMPL